MTVSKLCLVFFSALVVLSASFTRSFAADAGAPDSSAANMTGPERKYPSVYGSVFMYPQFHVPTNHDGMRHNVEGIRYRQIRSYHQRSGHENDEVDFSAPPPAPPHQPRFPAQYPMLR